MHLVHVGIATGRKRAQQVQGCRRLCVGLQHPIRIRNARVGGEVEPVDDVAAVAWQLYITFHFGRCRTWFRHLASHAADFNHWHFGAIGQHHRHLQHHLECVADVIGSEFSKAFGAISALQQKGLAARNSGQFFL